MKKYFINLKRSPERTKYISQEAKRVGLKDFHFFNAIDAKSKNISEISVLYNPKSWKAYWELTPTEVAVFESHRLLWEKCAKTNNIPFLICEDDIIMSSKLPFVLDEISKDTFKFDVIHLDCSDAVYRLGKPKKLDVAISLAPVLQPLASAAAYVISPSGARKLLYMSRNGFCDHVDDFITRPRKNFCILQILPAICVQGMFSKSSNVPFEIKISERTLNSNEIDFIHKGPFAYRLLKELRRFARSTSRKLLLDKSLINKGGSVGKIILEKDIK